MKNIRKITCIIFIFFCICCIFSIKFSNIFKRNYGIKHKNVENMDLNLNLNKSLKLKGTPQDFIVDMPLNMKEDVTKNSKQFVKGTVLTDSKNNKNFHAYAVVYNNLNNRSKNIYVYYNWSNIPRILPKYKDNLQISVDNNSTIVPKNWLEIHTIYKNDYHETFENNNVLDLSDTNIQWDNWISKLQFLSIKKNAHMYGYRKVTIEKPHNNTPIEINIKYNHTPGIDCKGKNKLIVDSCQLSTII